MAICIPDLALLSSFNPQSTLGALLIGLLISCCLFGITTIQAHMYYSRFPQDVPVCELAHCICISHTVYFFAVVNFGDPCALLDVTLTMDLAILLSGIIAAIAQSYFIERLRRLSNKRLIPVFCWVVSSIRCILLFVLTHKLIQSKHSSIADAIHKEKWLYTAVLSTGSGVDFFVAVYLAYYRRVSTISNFQSTSYMVDRVTAWAIGGHHAFCEGPYSQLDERNGTCYRRTWLVHAHIWIWTAIFCSLARALYLNYTLLEIRSHASFRLNGRVNFRGKGFTEIIQNDAPRNTVQAMQISKTTEVKVDPVFEYGVF
ncbi:hypothetical protein CVT26_001128 [Gymnopilus dilepis]|uniref:Uncharacterized protein n=1 Tax=Gymnopilus dilepis TaxID=231916 RepID=A0A409WW19_9AGAR|nr:hypothetical protein CVT26_001128 [Gymnopilus dilepis]